MSETPRAAWIALGSNLGERIDYLRGGVAELRQGGVLVTRTSSVYETAPVGGPEQPHYLNAVIEIVWRDAPLDLLTLCQQIETAADRVRDVHWGPRTLDLDIIAVDGVVIDSDHLVLPHPRAHERAFVLVPLAEIAPQAALPPHGTAIELLTALSPDERRTVRLTTLSLQD